MRPPFLRLQAAIQELTEDASRETVLEFAALIDALPDPEKITDAREATTVMAATSILAYSLRSSAGSYVALAERALPEAALAA
jgi:hypothetical protein